MHFCFVIYCDTIYCFTPYAYCIKLQKASCFWLHDPFRDALVHITPERTL